MTCDEFKDKVAELFDIQADPQTVAECEAHMAECADCRTYYEELKAAFEALTPRAALPERASAAAGKSLHSLPEASCSRSETPHGLAKTARHALFRRHSAAWQAAAAVALFLFGLFIGWNRLFTSPAVAQPPAAFSFAQSIRCVQNVGSFEMRLMVRTAPNENFAYFDPAADFVPIDISLLRQNDSTFFRVAKAGGRTVVGDGRQQYLWTTNGLYFKGGTDAGFLDNMVQFLVPERLLAMQQSAVELSKQTKVACVENDSTVVLTVRGSEKSQDLQQLWNQGRMYECPVIIRNVFSKNDGLLRSVHVWIEWKGRKVEMLRATDIRYNVMLSRKALTALPDVAPEVWTSSAAPAVRQPARLQMLRRETPEQAAQRIMKALCTGQTALAEEALSPYKAFLETLTKAYRGCRATDFEGRTDDSYPGVYVFYTLTKPDGTTQKEHIAVRNDNEQRIWIADGGL